MELSASKQDTLSSVDSPLTDAKSLKRQMNELPFIDTSKFTLDHSQNYEQNWNKYSVLFKENKNEALKPHENINLIHNNENHQKFLNSVQESKLSKSLTANHLQSRDEEKLSNKDNKNVSSTISHALRSSYTDMLQSSDNFCEKAMSDKKNIIRSDERIHKSPLERQDSTTLDIELSDAVKTPADHTSLVKRIDNKGPQNEELHSTLAQKMDDLKYLRQGGQLETGNKCHQFVHKQPYKQEIRCSATQAQSSTDGKILEKCEFFTGSQVTNLVKIHHADSRQLSQNYNGTTNILDSSAQVHKPVKLDQKIMKCCSSEDSAKFERSLDKQYTTPFNDKGIASESVQRKGKSFVFRQVTLVNIFFVAVVVLAMGVIYLYYRLEAIDSHGVLAANCRCQCHQDFQTNRNPVDDTRNTKSAKEDVYIQVMQHLGNDDQDTSTDEDKKSDVFMDINYKENSEKILDNSFPRKDQRDKTNTKDSHLSVLGLWGKSKDDRENTILKSRNLRDDFLISDVDVSSPNYKNNTKENDTDIDEDKDPTSHSADDFEVFKLEDFSLDSTREVRSRKARSDSTREARSRMARSSDNGKKVRDPNFTKAIKGQGATKPKRANSKSTVDSFEVAFFDMFKFSEHFLDKECSTYHPWGKGIQACRDATIILPHKNSVLPFYNATRETMSKDSKKRMILIDDKRHGEFRVQVPGDYLVHLNITVVDESKDIAAESNPRQNHEKYFLAIHLNGQAMLTCQQSGFRCPHMNHHASSKYKICNIIGLLELRKDDVLDIRTMEPNMKVRVENQRKSYFRVVLLNKLK